MNAQNNKYRFIQAAAMFLLLTLIGCGTGYRIHRSNGSETPYHIGKGGQKRVIYVVHKDGTLKIQDEKDPIVRHFLAGSGIDAQAKEYL